MIEALDWGADIVAVALAAVAVRLAARAERRGRRDRDRSDRLYLKLSRKLGDHIQSRLH